MLQHLQGAWQGVVQRPWCSWGVIQDDRLVLALRRILFAPGRRGDIVRLLLAAIIGVAIGGSMAFLAMRSSKLLMLVFPVLLLPFVAMMVQHLRVLIVVLLPAIVSFPVAKAFMRPSLEWTSLGVLAGFYISLALVALVVVYTLWAVQLLVKRGELANCMPILMVPHLLYVVVSFVSIIVAQKPLFTLFEWFLNLQAFLLYTYIVSTIRNRREIQWMMIILLFNLIFHGFMSFITRGLGRPMELGPAQLLIDDQGRVGGLFSHPNHATTFFYLMMPPALAILLTHPRRAIKALALVAFGAGFVGMAFTQSRGGFVATCMSLFVFFFLAVWRGWMSFKVPLIAGFIGALGFIPIAPIILQRFVEDDGGSAESRGPLAKLAWRMMLDHPVIGVGANNFPVNMFEYITPDLGEVHLYTVHNKFLGVWSETGTLGFIAFMLVMFTVLYHGWLCVTAPTNQDPFFPMVGLSFACSFIGMFTHMYVNVFRALYLIHIIWFSAGMTAVMAHLSRTPSEEILEYDPLDKEAKVCPVGRPQALPGVAAMHQGQVQREVIQ
jgi:O-antigen ligase